MQTWEMHKTPVQDKTPDPQFSHSLTKTDSLVTEKIWIEQSGLDFERRFKLIDNKWFLIYCKDITTNTIDLPPITAPIFSYPFQAIVAVNR